MSFPKDDRKVQSKSGKTFPSGREYYGKAFADAIAAALKADYGASPSGLKRLARAVDANERAVRNWLEGKNGPSGENLVNLMRHSDAVFEAVIGLASRGPSTDGAGLLKLRTHLAEALDAIDAYHRGNS